MKNSKYISTKTQKELTTITHFKGSLVSSLKKKARDMGADGADCKGLLRSLKSIKKAKAMKVAKSYKLSLKAYNELTAKAKTILNDFHTGHSMGCYRSVHIRTGVKKIKSYFATNDTLDSYAASCSYRATHGNLSIVLSADEIRSIEKIHGIWTLKNEDGSAKWLVESGNKQHYSVFWEKGFCVGESHGKTLEECETLEAIKAQTQINKIANNAKFIGVRHLKLAGACNEGIAAYAKRHNLNLEYGYNVGYLKSLENSTFFDRV